MLLLLNSSNVIVLGIMQPLAGNLNLGIDTRLMNSSTVFILLTISVIFGGRSTSLPLYIAQASITDTANC